MTTTTKAEKTKAEKPLFETTFTGRTTREMVEDHDYGTFELAYIFENDRSGQVYNHCVSPSKSTDFIRRMTEGYTTGARREWVRLRDAIAAETLSE